MKTQVMGQLWQRVGATLQTWRDLLVSFFHKPGAVLMTVLTHIFALWLSFKQVRLTFRILALCRLPEVEILRRVLQSNIYLVLIAMVACFVWLDLTFIKHLAGQLSSRFGKTLPEMWIQCLGRSLRQDLFNTRSTSGVSDVQGQARPGIPVSNMTSRPAQLTRKNPPRACKKATKY